MHPLLADLGRWHAGFFPRAGGSGLRLSRLDEVLLRSLSREWRTPTDVFVHDDAALRAWLSHAGDLYVATRLLQWSRHSGGRVVEGRKTSGRKSEMLRWSFRWQEGAAAILDALPAIDAAPLVRIGGAVAYDAARPWVSHEDAASGPYVIRRRLAG